MTVDNTWRLESVSIRDFLGFQGEAHFDFTAGFQVIEAPNHTGKSSLAMALLWGITGELPKLSRINKTSFRLHNRHAGDNAEPTVSITLAGPAEARMKIRRTSVRSGGKTGVLELSLPDEELTGDEAEERILSELGTKAATIEGCGIVLQDHRLKLVTGSDTEISEVINDMLGLQALSEVVPCLQELSSETEQFRKEVSAFMTAADPLVRWSAEDERLREHHVKLENAAVDAGVSSAQLETPDDSAIGELDAIASQLNVDGDATDGSIPSEVTRMRDALSLRRKESGHSQQLSDLLRKRTETESVANALRAQISVWELHDERVLSAREAGETNRTVLVTQRTDAEQTLHELEAKLVATHDEQEFLSAAYAHVLSETELSRCPVCEVAATKKQLTQRLKERLEIAVGDEIEALTSEKKSVKLRFDELTERLNALQELYADHEEIYREQEDLSRRVAIVATVPMLGHSSAKLLEEAESRRELIASLASAAAALELQLAEIRKQESAFLEELAKKEELFFQPIDARIIRVQELLFPLSESVRAMGKHADTLDSVTSRKASLSELEAETQALSGRLKKLAKCVSEDQEESAREAINARLPFVSKFFASVANNPDYTGLHIETTVSREKVAYRMKATSSKMAALTDSVGHVLSEGDLCAAGMALLLGLASGDSHRLGLLVLDDPGQGMDSQLQSNLARELGALEHKPQVIVLTHQSEFAARLESHGCERRTMGRWEGGRLVDPT